jgi:hypothetical protein
MRYLKAARFLAIPTMNAVLGATLAGAALVNPIATNVALAQTEPAVAANGVLLPPLGFDPAAARSQDLTESAVVPATEPAPVATSDESTVTGTSEAATDAPDAAAEAPEATTDAPEAATDAPENGNSMTTSLGGSNVAVSSVGGSYEVDRPKKRSDRKK